MASITIWVNPKTGQNYLPRDIRNDGFRGKVECVVSSITLLLIKPSSKLADVHASLRIIRDDIALRMESEEKNLEAKSEGGPIKPAMVEQDGRAMHPIFWKYSRTWLSQVTGYSKGYLCRVAKGHIHPSKSFVDRVCFRLHGTREELFLPNDH